MGATAADLSRHRYTWFKVRGSPVRPSSIITKIRVLLERGVSERASLRILALKGRPRETVVARTNARADFNKISSFKYFSTYTDHFS